MRTFILILTALLAWGQLSAREVVNINRNWRFFSDSEGSSDHAAVVNLPHSWNTDALSGKKDYFRGVGNYMKDINIPAQWEGKRVFIRFYGAASVATLMVNGYHVGEHRGGYTAFTFELTRFLKYGQSNSLWVIVNNAPLMDVMPTAGDINIYGGLYRDVELIVTEPTLVSVTDYSSDGIYLAQRRVSPERAEVDAMIHIDGRHDQNLIVSLAVTTPRKDTVVYQASRFRIPSQGKGVLTIPIVMERPTLWNGTENPYMYNVQVKLSEDTLTLDSLAVPLGLRYFSVDPISGFSLNGQPYPLHGAVYYEDRATVGPALTSYQVQEDVDLMTEMGVNAVRAADYPHSPDFYTDCDRRGLVVWTDLPFVGPAYLTDRGYINTPSFQENGRQQLREMIAQRYNNPSVLLWGIFSKLNARGDDPTAYVQELNSLAMEQDDSRLTVATSNQDGNINFITDLIVWDQIFGWKEGQPSDVKIWLDQLKANWSSLCSGLSYGAGASIYHQDDSLYRPDYNGNWHPERWQTYLHEEYYANVKDASFLWGLFVANMFDFGAAGNTSGEGRGINDLGMVTFDRKYRKDAFYFYKANWNQTDPFVYIAEKRWDRRVTRTQTITVFSNATQVELFVNGISQGTKVPINGTFTWEEVELSDGMNSLEARSESAIDYAEIEVAYDRLKHGIK